MINAEIDRMLQEEENTMAETLYDKYMADQEFAAMMKHEDEVMMLTERIAYLEAQLSDIAEAHEQVLSEKCPSNEVHCTCVPYLRQEVKDLQAENAELKTKNRELENHIVLEGSISEWIEAALSGENVSDFALSFPVVREIADLKAQLAVETAQRENAERLLREFPASVENGERILRATSISRELKETKAQLSDLNKELGEVLAERDQREGALVTDIADLHEKRNELREAAAWFIEAIETSRWDYVRCWTPSRDEILVTVDEAETALRSLTKG